MKPEYHSPATTHQPPTTNHPSPVTHACVLAIDPGTAKCGVAVVRADGQVLYRGIVATETLAEQARTLTDQHRPLALLCGNGTGSKPILQTLRAASLPLPIQPVDESHTSEAARTRFVRENTPPFLQRLLPRSLRTPWRPYDDYVAIILAEGYWQTHAERDNAPSNPARRESVPK